MPQQPTPDAEPHQTMRASARQAWCPPRQVLPRPPGSHDRPVHPVRREHHVPAHAVPRPGIIYRGTRPHQPTQRQCHGLADLDHPEVPHAVVSAASVIRLESMRAATQTARAGRKPTQASGRCVKPSHGTTDGRKPGLRARSISTTPLCRPPGNLPSCHGATRRRRSSDALTRATRASRR